ncbi:MAG: hypothetical protein WC667_08865 [Sulfurimonas sp.]|jgi:hypothetical protein
MEPYVLPIHFGNLQGKHEINSNSLLTFIEAYKEIGEVFGLNTDIQIGVPEEGGWKTNLLFTISFIGLSPITALLTGETADEWAKKGNIYILQQINKLITTEANNLSDEIPKECIKQKNKIYQQFQKDNCIDSFKIDNFPAIPKNNFHLYIKDVPDEEYVYLGETNITVRSPDWQGKRSWRGNIEILEDKESAFDFYKDLTGKFWEKVRFDLLPLHTTDIMKVQLIKRPTHKVKYLVMRVLNYNNETIDSSIGEEDINKFATSNIHSSVASKHHQLEFSF